MRYFERHGRTNTKTTWSERQTGIYQCIDLERDKSTWIVIQASVGAKALLKRLPHSSDATYITVIDSLQLHTQLATELSRNWRSYINFLDARLTEIVRTDNTVQYKRIAKLLQDEKALDSRVDRERRFSYPLTFRDVQVLEQIRRKLLKASLLLKSNIDLAESLMTAFGRIIPYSNPSNDFHSFLQHKSDLARHLQVVNLLLDRLFGTSRLV